MADEPRPSVFGYVDQDEVIKRIDDVKDDDLASCFFGDSIDEVENAATEIFDIGVRNEAEVGTSAAGNTFAVPAAGPRNTPATTPTVPTATSTAAAASTLSADDRARQAFILGGPAAVQKD